MVDDGAVITAGGLSAGLDLGLWVVEREVDGDLAHQVARDIEHTPGDDVGQAGSTCR